MRCARCASGQHDVPVQRCNLVFVCPSPHLKQCGAFASRTRTPIEKLPSVTPDAACGLMHAPPAPHKSRCQAVATLKTDPKDLKRRSRCSRSTSSRRRR